MDTQVTAELKRVGLTEAEAAEILGAEVPPGWLLPWDIPVRVLRSVPDGAGAAAFAAALRTEVAPIWAHAGLCPPAA